MSPREILLSLAPGHPSREAAARCLLDLLRVIAQKGSVHLAGDRTDRDEIVSRVALKVVRSSPLPVAGEIDEKCRAYLRAMLRHCWIDELRRRRRERPGHEDVAGLEIPVDAEVEPPDFHAVANARVLLERLADHAFTRIQPRYVEGARLAWRQIRDLVFEEMEMRHILERDEKIGLSSSAEEVVRARDRTLQNHKRLRDRMLEAIDALTMANAMSSDDEATARRAMRFLFRCQRNPTPPSSDRRGVR